jgi:hypothetical protein
VATKVAKPIIPISTKNYNTNKQSGVEGHFGMQQGKVYKELHNLHLGWH